MPCRQPVDVLDDRQNLVQRLTDVDSFGNFAGATLGQRQIATISHTRPLIALPPGFGVTQTLLLEAYVTSPAAPPARKPP